MKFTHQVFALAAQFCFVQSGLSIKCYQCSSSNDPAKADNCGAGGPFNTAENIPIDCNSTESVEREGTFCQKITTRDGRWTKVQRRCAFVANTGGVVGCRPDLDENGKPREDCYCSEDACNGSGKLQPMFTLFAVAATFFAWKLT